MKGWIFMSECMCIQIPDACCCIKPGYKVKLGRFESEQWVVGYGWFSFGGNRPFCGWFLTSCDSGEVKPLQRPDLDDIYVIES